MESASIGNFPKVIARYRLPTSNEKGVALLLVVFVIVFASLVVFELGRNAFVDQQVARSYSEGVQADFIAKSALNLGRALLERTKDPGFENTDSLLEPWALIGSAPSLPIPGFFGDPRLLITDESSKIDINNIVVQKLGSSITPKSDSAATPEPKSFWLEALHNLFSEVGFSAEQFPPGSFRTPGDASFPPEIQAAVIHDWIDRDSNSYSSREFTGQGLESSMPKDMFFNRNLYSLSELLLVPGMTAERLSQIARFVKVSPSSGARSSAININTVTPEVLRAMGFPDNIINEFMEHRKIAPLSERDVYQGLQILENPDLSRNIVQNSSEFSIYVRVNMPNVTRWLRATVTRSAATGTKVERVELY